jgi:transcriptional regulator with XRE-family HTH domain
MKKVKCGTFMDWSFGSELRRIRVHNKLTMREMCKRMGMDVGNYSKLESSRASPPRSKKAIMKIIKDLDTFEFQEERLIAAAFNFHLGSLRGKFE